ncbi:NB-ARC domain-containing protein [Cognatishimia sp. WU-CL00825]|uniref:NB-ARC domain-containing protein n=1 Tax=Cognatishimia sp. WU-CL00825 TaxID=3127658 RepID=UPI003365922E
MTVCKVIGYADFKHRVKQALKNNQDRHSVDKNDELIEDGKEYREQVGLAARKYRDAAFGSNKKGMDQRWQKWISEVEDEVVEGLEAKEDWEQIAKIDSDKINGLVSKRSGFEDFAFAIHYRLHKDLKRKKFASIVDSRIWDRTFEEKFHQPVFEETPDSELPASYPIHLKLDDSHQPERPEFEEIKTALLSREDESDAVTVEVQGSGGYGKTAIAEEICLDEKVQTAFSGGIYWLQFGLAQSEAKDSDGRKYTLAEAIDGMLARQYPPEVKPTLNPQTDATLLASFIDKLPDKPILLIADDLWTYSQASWIEHLREDVSLLATTRIRSIYPQIQKTVAVKSLSLDASFDLLAHGLLHLKPIHKQRLRKISVLFAGWALLLRLANATARVRHENGARWSTILAELENYAQLDDILGWDDETDSEDSLAKRRKLIGYSIKAGLDALPDETSRFAALSLAVFPEDTDIPFSVISEYWRQVSKASAEGRPPIKALKANTIRSALHRLSFFRDFDARAETLQIHDVLIAYFRERFPEQEQKKAIHRALLSSINMHCVDGWHTLPRSHVYGWKNLIYHIEQTHDFQAANELRLNYDWIRTKLRMFGVSELQGSFYTNYLSPEASLVRRAIDACSHILRKSPESLAHQLQGRLQRGKSEEICRLLTATRNDPDFWPIQFQFGAPLIASNGLRLVGHDDVVHTAIFSADGLRLLTASWDATVRIWNSITGAEVFEPLRHDGPVNAAVFNRAGSRVASASAAGSAWIWDASTGEAVVGPLCHNGAISTIRFNRDGDKVVTASSDGIAKIWDAITGKCLHDSLSHESHINCAEFNDDGSQVITASGDGLARIWDVSEGAMLLELCPNEQEVTKAEFSPDGTRVLTVVIEGGADIWDLREGSRAHEPKSLDYEAIDATFSSDGQKVVVSLEYGSARIWDVDSGAPLQKLSHSSEEIHYATFNHDNSRVLTTTLEGGAQIWEAATGEICAAYSGHEASVKSGVFDRDGGRVATASVDRTVRIRDVAVHPISNEPSCQDGLTNCIDVSSDGKQIITGSADGAMHVWDISTGRPVAEPIQHDYSVQDSVFAPSSDVVVTVSNDRFAYVWDSFGSTAPKQVLNHDELITHVAVSLNGERVLTASDDNSVRLWDTKHGSMICQPYRHRLYVSSVCFDTNGEFAASASWDKTVRIWDAHDGGQVVKPLVHDGWVFSARFDSEGKNLITSSSDGFARIWDVRTGDLIAEPIPHDGELAYAEFGSQGKQFLTKTLDGRVRVWSTTTSEVIMDLSVKNRAIEQVSFSSCGTYVIAAHDDCSVRIWSVSNKLQIAQIFFDSRVASLRTGSDLVVFRLRNGRFSAFSIASG